MATAAPGGANRRFRAGADQLGLPLLDSDTAIQPVLVGDATLASALSDALLARGVLISAIRPPTVAAGTSRLRITLTAGHSAQQVEQLLAALAAVWPGAPDTEYLPALGCARQELVLLHGWSSGREVWRRLLVPLRSWANITLVDLPGCTVRDTDGFDGDLAGLLSAVLEQIPQRAVYLGWSLGGQLATLLAERAPQRVLGARYPV